MKAVRVLIIVVGVLLALSALSSRGPILEPRQTELIFGSAIASDIETLERNYDIYEALPPGANKAEVSQLIRKALDELRVKANALTTAQKRDPIKSPWRFIAGIVFTAIGTVLCKRGPS